MSSYNVSHVHGDGDSSGQASASGNQLPECTTSKVDFSKIDSSEKSSPLGLTLRKNQSFLNLIQEKLLGEAKNSNPKRKRKVEDSSTEATETKQKASHIPVRLLRIGSWERTSQYGEGLMAKFYYGKSLLNWDVLEDTGLVNRIEIRWSDITAIRATFTKNEHDVLEIEVKTVPRFLKEVITQAKRSCTWLPTSDFTNGQAFICRRHIIFMPHGILQKHYKLLLQRNSYLKSLSQRPIFSSSTYFGTPQIQPSWNISHKKVQKTNVGMTSISKSSTAPSASMTSEVTSASSNEVNNKKASSIQSKTTLQQYVPLDVGDIPMSNSDGWVLAQELNEPLMPSDLLDFGSRVLNGPDEVFSDIDETDLGWNF